MRVRWETEHISHLQTARRLVQLALRGAQAGGLQGGAAVLQVAARRLRVRRRVQLLRQPREPPMLRLLQSDLGLKFRS